jgi:hypothetical protein
MVDMIPAAKYANMKIIQHYNNNRNYIYISLAKASRYCDARMILRSSDCFASSMQDGRDSDLNHRQIIRAIDLSSALLYFYFKYHDMVLTYDV